MNWRERFHAIWEAVVPRHLVVLLWLALLAALPACRERSTQQAQQFGIFGKMKLVIPYQIPFLSKEVGPEIMRQAERV